MGIISLDQYKKERNAVDGVVELDKNAITMHNWNRWWDNAWTAATEYSKKCKGIEELAGTLEGKSCVVCAAGPSLSKHLDFIREVAGNVHIICVDRAFPQVWIDADMVVSVDQSIRCCDFMMRIRKQDDVKAALSLTSNPATYDLMLSREIETYQYGCAMGMFYENVKRVWPELAPRCRLSGGAIVTVTAIDIAVMMGAKRIITIGNDLMCGKETLHEELQKNPNLIDLGDNRYAAEAFIIAAYALREFVKIHPDVEFLDLSGGLDKGFVKINESEALKAC